MNVMPKFNNETLAWILNHLPINSNASVLIDPTGDATLTYAIATKVKTVISADVSAQSLINNQQQVQQRGITNIVFTDAITEALPYPTEQFDLVISQFNLHNILEPQTALQELYRVTKRKGYLAVMDIIAPENIQLAESYNYFSQLRELTHVAAFNSKQLKQLFVDLHLKVTTTASYHNKVNVDAWLQATETDATTATELKEYLVREINGGIKTGLQPFYENNTLMLMQTWGLVLGIK